MWGRKPEKFTQNSALSCAGKILCNCFCLFKLGIYCCGCLKRYSLFFPLKFSLPISPLPSSERTLFAVSLHLGRENGNVIYEYIFSPSICDNWEL